MNNADFRSDQLAASTLSGLVASNLLAQPQADRIAAVWPHLDADAFAHPYLKAVPEHTRAYLERLSESCR